MKQFITLFHLLACCLSLIASPQVKGLLFHHSFDNEIQKPDFAANSKSILTCMGDSLRLSRPGADGKGAALQADNSCFLSFPGNRNFNPVQGTVSFWIKPVNWQMYNNKYFQIFFEIRDSRQKYRFLIYKEKGGNHLIASIAAGGSRSRRVLCGTHWRINTWHKIDFTWDTGRMALYIDGALPADSTAALDFKTPPDYPQDLPYAPVWLNSIRGWIVNPEWQTMYDDLRIHDYPLTPQEIEKSYGRKKTVEKAAMLPPRPRFEKKHLKKIWCQVNPWFLPNHSPADVDSTGSPDHSWTPYSEDMVQMWRQTAELCSSFGIDGLALEVVVRRNGVIGYGDIFQKMVDGFRQAGTHFQGLPFLTARKYPGDMPRLMARAFGGILPLLKNHPNVFRLDGAPVIPVYLPYVFTPEEWHAIITAVENKCGRCIWLADIRDTYMRQDAPQGFTQWLRDYLQVFDGITLYANWPVSSQENFYRQIAPVIKKEFPEKIYETGPHNTFTPHTRYEGMRPRLTEKFIRSWDLALQTRPDSITITNLFDIEEYSRILPSYEMDDILMKISEYYIRKWKGLPPRESLVPDFNIVQYTHLTIGDEAHFEVIGFPIAGKEKNYTVRLEICDEKESVLHGFPSQEICLDAMRILKYALPTESLAGHRALFPRLHYSASQTRKTADAFPPTVLTASLPPHLLTWGRSMAHMIPLPPAYRYWSMDGLPPGETLPYPVSGTATLKWHLSGPEISPSEQIRVLRNFREIARFKREDLLNAIRIYLPDPGDALDQYALELEDGKGNRYLTSSIWVAGTSRTGSCSLPLPIADQKIKTFDITRNRIPFFHYPCSHPVNMLQDTSGYDHHGMLSAARAPRSKHRMRGYRHEFCNGIPPYIRHDSPEFRKDPNGTGYLHFDADRKTCAIINGGTASPYSYTCEMQVRPAGSGHVQGLLGTPRGQYNLALTPEGRVRTWRILRTDGTRKISGEIISSSPLPTGTWSRIAIVYDLQKISLYINGKLQGEAPSAYDPMHQWLNSTIVGGLCKNALTPIDFFTGDIRQIRLYGRNLKPEEFLQD